MTVYTTGQTKLYNQVVSDLEKRHELYRKYAYADPRSALYGKVSSKLWGTKPARDLLPAGTDWSKGEPWTVGIGYTKGTTVDSTMELPQARKITEGEVAELDAQLQAALPWYREASFTSKTVLLNMAYNMGLRGLLGFKNTLVYVRDKNYVQAAANMEKSLWFRQTKSRAVELVERMRTQTIKPEHLVQ